ncbi:hypothetical protein [Francisella philomiragia]|uniref:hypothetical protein n=1 Tax=Francisella philomiragia TaxID=28110 RepID=UPI0001AF77CD|nr:hypothetical protein [Francisella philomiragia]MBK2238841.1 hypothetical protein [Francisella philomiragia]
MTGNSTITNFHVGGDTPTPAKDVKVDATVNVSGNLPSQAVINFVDSNGKKFTS